MVCRIREEAASGSGCPVALVSIDAVSLSLPTKVTSLDLCMLFTSDRLSVCVLFNTFENTA